MIMRYCPRCGTSWYSSDTHPWRCEKCGKLLDDKHNKKLTEGMRKDNVNIVFGE